MVTTTFSTKEVAMHSRIPAKTSQIVIEEFGTLPFTKIHDYEVGQFSKSDFFVDFFGNTWARKKQYIPSITSLDTTKIISYPSKAEAIAANNTAKINEMAFYIEADVLKAVKFNGSSWDDVTISGSSSVSTTKEVYFKSSSFDFIANADYVVDVTGGNINSFLIQSSSHKNADEFRVSVTSTLPTSNYLEILLVNYDFFGRTEKILKIFAGQSVTLVRLDSNIYILRASGESIVSNV